MLCCYWMLPWAWPVHTKRVCNSKASTPNNIRINNEYNINKNVYIHPKKALIYSTQGAARNYGETRFSKSWNHDSDPREKNQASTAPCFQDTNRWNPEHGHMPRQFSPPKKWSLSPKNPPDWTLRYWKRDWNPQKTTLGKGLDSQGSEWFVYTNETRNAGLLKPCACLCFYG